LIFLGISLGPKQAQLPTPFSKYPPKHRFQFHYGTRLFSHPTNLSILPGRYTGTGDVCAALLFGWTAEEDDLKASFEKVSSTMYPIIRHTSDYLSGDGGSCSSITAKTKRVEVNINQANN
jgi:pyridoxal/pyridoxine/pyridoxamine kinase